MNRRSLLVSAGISFSTIFAGCLAESGEDDQEGVADDTSGNGDGDRFPEQVELDVTGRIESEQELTVKIELENSTITKVRPSESLWLTVENADDEPIIAEDSTELFPSEFVLRPAEHNPTVYLERTDETVETVSPGESKSIQYTFAVSTELVDRRFEGTERIEYAYDDTVKEGEITLVFNSETILQNET